jgi:predicted Zn finger-like uncharacterized protein
MLIECPSCARRYTITRATLGSGGREVACSACDTRWFAAAELAAMAPIIRAEAHSERSRPPSHAALSSPASGRPAAGGRLGLPRVAPVLALGVALLCAASAAIAARIPLVRHVPQLGPLFAAVGLPANVRGLSLAGVETRRDVSGREAYLDIAGDIANVRTGTTPLPALRLTILGADGQPLYGWTERPPKPRLAEGERVPFHARLAAPPAEGRSVIVRFASADEEAPAR